MGFFLKINSHFQLKTLADSITLNIGNWLGLPSVPVILMHRPLPNFIPSVFESDPLSLQRLTAITLWCTLQALGRDVIVERLFMAFKSCQILNEVVSKISGIKVLVSNLNYVLFCLNILDPGSANQCFQSNISYYEKYYIAIEGFL
jgi:hypothetical protein